MNRGALVAALRQRIGGIVTRARAYLADHPSDPALMEALDVAERGDEAEAIADEVIALVQDLVDPVLMGAVLADLAAFADDWPLGIDRPARHALRVAVFLATAESTGPLALSSVSPALDRWPRGPMMDRPAAVIAEWARPQLNALATPYADPEGLGDLLVRHTTESGGLSSFVWASGQPEERHLPARGILLVWLAERRARTRNSTQAAAVEAYHAVRELVNAPFGRDHFEAVDRAIREPDGDEIALAAATNDAHRGAFAGELAIEARRVADALFAADPPETDADAGASVPGPQGPLLWWDAAFADILGTLGKAGVEGANLVRRKGAERQATLNHPGLMWALWFEARVGELAPARWLRTLARVLWLDRWRPALAREQDDQARELTPAYPVEVVDTLAAGLTTWKVQSGEGADLLIGRDGSVVGHLLAPSGLTDVLAAESRAPTVWELRSVDTHRFLLWFLRELRLRERAGVADFRVIHVDGRWTRLEELTGADRQVLSRVVPLLGRLAIPGPNATDAPGNLYAFNPGVQARGQRGGWLEVTAGTMIHPSALHNRPRWDRATLPFPDLPPMDRVLGNRGNEHGPLATLRLFIVHDLQQAGAELVTEGGARIPGVRWLERLNQVGLVQPFARVDRVIDAWLSGGDDYPPFLVRVGADRYHLHPSHHAGARAYLDVGARESQQGTKLATAAQAAKRSRLTKREK